MKRSLSLALALLSLVTTFSAFAWVDDYKMLCEQSSSTYTLTPLYLCESNSDRSTICMSTDQRNTLHYRRKMNDGINQNYFLSDDRYDRRTMKYRNNDRKISFRHRLKMNMGLYRSTSTKKFELDKTNLTAVYTQKYGRNDEIITRYTCREIDYLVRY